MGNSQVTKNHKRSLNKKSKIWKSLEINNIRSKKKAYNKKWDTPCIHIICTCMRECNNNGGLTSLTSSTLTPVLDMRMKIQTTIIIYPSTYLYKIIYST